MNSTPNPKPAEPDDVLVARADERLAHAYEQIARADEQLARVTEQLSKLDGDAGRHASAVQGQRSSRGGPALRGVVGLLLAACIFGAAIVSQSSYGGDAAKLIIARWAPRLVPTPSGSQEKPELPAQPSPPPVQLAAAEAVPSQATPSVQTIPQEIAAPMPPELTQLLQTMAGNLANMQQEIEQLKASQEQMASDNAKLVDEIKAGQAQMTNLIAKVSEQNLQPKPSTPPARPIASPTRKPVSTRSSPQARAHAPTQLPPDDQ
ncbi:MAG: hypothetical protein JO283_06680 [Bradyrhizobium sp.]|nr:hypothetical protein [Bradyrhizobium sp.]